MIENGLTIPEGCKVGEASGGIAGLQLPANASDELKEEVTWWKWSVIDDRIFLRQNTSIYNIRACLCCIRGHN